MVLKSVRVDWNYVEDMTPQLIANNLEVSVSAANATILEYTAIYDFILTQMIMYGTSADRKGIYFENLLVDVQDHGANTTPVYDIQGYIPQGTTIKITSISAAAGTHGASIYGKPIRKEDIDHFEEYWKDKLGLGGDY